MDPGVVLVVQSLTMEPTLELGKSICHATLELYPLEFNMIVTGRLYGEANMEELEGLNQTR
jgi:hypothetical protein